ncbi:hypothetical protein AKJ16_DCAP27335, partial [Drosera capensis]
PRVAHRNYPPIPRTISSFSTNPNRPTIPLFITTQDSQHSSSFISRVPTVLALFLLGSIGDLSLVTRNGGKHGRRIPSSIDFPENQWTILSYVSPLL